jgi:hypothetical protein
VVGNSAAARTKQAQEWHLRSGIRPLYGQKLMVSVFAKIYHVGGVRGLRARLSGKDIVHEAVSTAPLVLQSQPLQQSWLIIIKKQLVLIRRRPLEPPKHVCRLQHMTVRSITTWLGRKAESSPTSLTAPSSPQPVHEIPPSPKRNASPCACREAFQRTS